MSDSARKKRVRQTAQEDVLSDKKLKRSNESDQVATMTATSITTGATNASAFVDEKGRLPTIHKAPFGSPVPSKIHPKDSKEATPFASKPAKKASKQVIGNTTMTARVERKAETAVGEEMAVVTSQDEPLVRIVYRGSWVYSTLLFFLWIGSSAVLGGMFLMEKLNHEMHTFQLEQKLLDMFPPIVETEKTKNEKALLDLVEEYKIKAMESEAKLQGCKREFRDSLMRLERK